MKGHFFKKALAIVIGASLIIGNSYAVQAQDSVSSGNVLSESVSAGNVLGGSDQNESSAGIVVEKSDVLENHQVPTKNVSSFSLKAEVANANSVSSGELTINHYLYEEDAKGNPVISDLFRPFSQKDVAVGYEVKDFIKQDGYTVRSVELNGVDKTTDAADGELSIENFVDGEAVINVFYTAAVNNTPVEAPITIPPGIGSPASIAIIAL